MPRLLSIGFCAFGSTDRVRATTGVVRVAGVLAALVLAYGAPAHADCALIPTAVKNLESTVGSVDRPYAAPGDTVTINAPVSCEPGANEPHFDPDPTKNVVTLLFTPPASGPTTPVQIPAADVSVAGCNIQGTRCTALLVKIPAATFLPSGGGPPLPLTGPARLTVQNTNAGTPTVPEAQIDDLFEPTFSCSSDNRFRSLFRSFTILPPRNVYTAGTKDLQATVDGTGSLLIPFDYSQVLAGKSGAPTARILSVTASLPDGMGGTLNLQKSSEPQDFDFVRAFSLQGRPIPPILEVNGAGDTIVGSVDFVDSLLRIARQGPDPVNDPVKFDLEGALVDGKGPLVLAGVTLATNAAVPLNSLNRSSGLVAVARDEALEAPFDTSGQPVPGNQNGDADANDRVVQIVNAATGDSFDTAQAVVEAANSPRRAVIATGRNVVAFLQSEFAQGELDVNGDGDALDGILRVVTASGASLASIIGNTSGAAQARIAGPAGPKPLVIGPDATGSSDVLWYAVDEFDEATLGVQRLSLGPGNAEILDGASFDPALSVDGSTLAFTSEGTAFLPAAGGAPGSGSTLTVEQISLSGHAHGNLVAVTTGNFSFLPGPDALPDFDLFGLGSGFFGAFSLNLSPTSGLVWGTFAIDGGASFQASTAITKPGVFTLFNPNGSFDDQSFFVTSQPIDTFFANPAPPSLPGLSQFRFEGDIQVVDGSISSSGDDFDVDGLVQVTAQVPVGGRQIYLTPTSGATVELVSRSSAGTPGDGPSNRATLSGDGSQAVYASQATNLIPSDTEGHQDIFLLDRTANSVMRISASSGVGGDGNSANAQLAGDGSSVVYESDAENLAPGDANGLRDVILYDVSQGTQELVSVGQGGAPANGPSSEPDVSFDGRYVVFVSAASNLVSGDSNGVADVFVRDRQLGLTTRVSLGQGSVEANGAALEATISDDARYVAFSSAATNLVPGALLNAPVQCYVVDLQSHEVVLMSVAPSGRESANADCSDPIANSDGSAFGFGSAASNLTLLAPNAAMRPFVFHRVSGVVSTPAGASLSAGGSRVGLGSFATAFSSPDPVANLGPDLPDTNGLEDVFLATDVSGVDQNGDGDRHDPVLHQLVSDGVTTSVLNTGLAIQKAIVDGPRALAIPNDGSDPVLLNGLGSFPLPVGPVMDAAMSSGIGCLVDLSGQVFWFDPASASPTANLVSGIRADSVRAGGDHCAIGALEALQAQDLNGDGDQLDRVLLVLATTGMTTNVGASFEDAVMDAGHVAFRTCEASEGQQDLNFDTDHADCVMQVYDLAMDQLRNTRLSAIRCTFPGCDPFFEPYRLTGPVLSFVGREVDEVDANGSGTTNPACLPTSPAGQCDLTADGDGDDAAVQILNLVSNGVQVFPVSEQNPPDVPPFPMPEPGSDTMLALQLPAVLLGPEFADRPPDELVTLIVGDSDADGILDSDGVQDPAHSVGDNCEEVPNPDQVDTDGDGYGAGCDVTLTSQIAVENDPVNAMLVPQDDNPTDNPGNHLCDLDRNGIIDDQDVGQVFADRGTLLTVQDDRDPDGDLEVTVLDARQCALMCTNPDCAAAMTTSWEPATTSSTTGSSGGSCGLLGIELLLVTPWFTRRWRLRRRRA